MTAMEGHASISPDVLARYAGDAVVTRDGSWNRAQRTGYKVVRLKCNHGLPSGAYEDCVTGCVVSANKVWGRPTGLVVAQGHGGIDFAVERLTRSSGAARLMSGRNYFLRMRDHGFEYLRGRE